MEAAYRLATRATDAKLTSPARSLPQADSGPRHILIVWMLAAVAAVAFLAYWDERREEAAALGDFAEEQAALAQALSRALAERLAVVERDGLEGARRLMAGQQQDTVGDVHVSFRQPDAPSDSTLFQFGVRRDDDAPMTAAIPMVRLLASIRALEHPGTLRVLVRPPRWQHWLGAADGAAVSAEPLDGATKPGVRSIRLPRADAAMLGLPARTAMAGVARIDAGALGEWTLLVVTTAQAERDRGTHGQWRLLLSVVVAGGLVLAFGSAALRRQARQLELGHALTIATLETERDDELLTADKLATMGALATGIAHEVATPLGVIMARAEQIASAGDAGDRTRRAAELIGAQADRIDVVIRGFLALARGRTPRLERARPGELAVAAVGLVEHRFAKAEVSLSSELDSSGAALVACDRTMFEQVLVNLLLNACEACAPGGRVSLSIRSDRDRVAFIIDDDGVGIDDETAARATEPFFTTKPEGTGLGLAITNEIVSHHRGSLLLRARAGGGTQAIVELPAVHREGLDDDLERGATDQREDR
jgi:two-component system NtrC family sensor kinase